MKPKLLAQGAEAKIFLVKDKHLKKEMILKSRSPKSYRHPALDKKIIIQRTRREAKILTKALNLGINVPKVLDIKDSSINLQHIKGDRLSEALNTYPKTKQSKIMKKIGKEVSKLHEANIVHGDLTTSNIILAETPNKEGRRFAKPPKAKDSIIGKRSSTIFLIDFGLGFISTKIEDKAVDVHLIKQALEAKHFRNWEELFKEFLKEYQPKEKREILERLKEVERRGRYKY